MSEQDQNQGGSHAAKEKKTGFFGRFFEKLDQSMKAKADENAEKGCCCCNDDESSTSGGSKCC